MDSKETVEVSLAILLSKNIGNIKKLVNLLYLQLFTQCTLFINYLLIIIINKKGSNEGAFNI
jgi:hypothetical protein